MNKSNVSKSKSPDVFQIVTDQILDLLDKGTIPWRKPWKGGFAGQPKNVISKKAYRGINTFILSITAENAGFDSPFWLSYKQAKSLGGNVKKGEKSSLVVFWRWIEKTETDVESGKVELKKIPFLRYYRVFNVAQCENLDLSKIPENPDNDIPDLDFSPVNACEGIIGNFKDCPGIYHDQGAAYYQPSTDEVHMPKRENFSTVEDYYSTLFHEVTHSTGHETRLGRHDKDKSLHFGSETYSKEELVAEMGAAFLCGICDISNNTVENSAAYIKGWSSKIKGDRKLVVHAAAQAQKATDYITNKEFKE